MTSGRGGVGPGKRRGRTAARGDGRSGSRAPRALSATRRPSGPGASRPPRRGRVDTAAAPAPRRPAATERRSAMAVIKAPLTRQILALGLAIGVVALSLAYPLRGYLRQQAAEAQAAVELEELQREVADRQAQVAAFDDPTYIRAEAKRRLQYVMPGDTVFVVKMPDSIPAGPLEEAPTGEASYVDGDGQSDPAGAESAPWYATLWDTLTGDEG